MSEFIKFGVLLVLVGALVIMTVAGSLRCNDCGKYHDEGDNCGGKS